MPFRGLDAIDAGLLTWAALRGPAWRRLLPGIYVRAGSEPDYRTWCRAAALWGGTMAVIGGVSAASFWGVVDTPSDGQISLVMPPGTRRRAPARVRPVRASLDRADIVDLAGVPVTSAVRTAFDLARTLDHVAAVVVIDTMLARHVLQLSDVVAYAQAHRGWPGVGRALRVFRGAEPRSESPMETRLRLVIVAGGLPRPVAQYDVRDPAGRFVARVDLAYPQWRIAIEYDGDYHRDRQTYRDDQRRANALRVAGWTILRFTAADVWRRPEQIVADIRAIMPV
jgi:very-short-patch-repair endonuclease